MSVVAGIVSFMAAPYAPNLVLGVGERISIGAFLLWVVVLAVALWRTATPGERRVGQYGECVRAFKALVRRGPLTLLSRTLRLPPHPTRDDLERFRAGSGKAEAVHVLSFLLVVVLAAGALLAGWVASGLWALLIRLLLNGYPVILQRYNRAKTLPWQVGRA